MRAYELPGCFLGEGGEAMFTKKGGRVQAARTGFWEGHEGEGKQGTLTASARAEAEVHRFRHLVQ